MSDSYHFVFEDADTARLFVQRLAHYLRDIAILVIGNQVTVIDGHDSSKPPQREEILRLARSSGAARVMVGGPSETFVG